jgi:hypothetical protein
MMKFSLSKWQMTQELGGLLFYAQSAMDMLFDYALDTYKVPTLNTHSMAYECVVFIDQVEMGIIDPSALRSIIDEFLFNFSNDNVIKNIFGPKKDRYIKLITHKKEVIKRIENKNDLVNLRELKNMVVIS